MATDIPPTGPAPESFPEEDEFEFEFDPADELEPSNEMLDVILTRAGEMTLDLIEAVQEHPVLTASIFAAGVGAVVGLVVGGLIPRRKAPTALAAAAALQAAEALDDAGLPGRLSAAQRRLGQSVESAGATLRERRLLTDGLLRDGLLRRLPGRGLDTASEGAAAAAAAAETGAGRVASVVRPWERAQAAGHLVPLALELLRNEIVRDLIAHALAGRLRRSAHL
jgi:hypothetical protein